MPRWKKKSNPLIPLCIVLMVLLLGMTVLSVQMWRGKTKAEKEASEYKTSYENLVEENKKAEQAAKEAKERAKQEADDYQTAYISSPMSFPRYPYIFPEAN